MILDGRLSRKGIVDPTEVPFEPFMEELRKRGLVADRLEEEWKGDLNP